MKITDVTLTRGADKRGKRGKADRNELVHDDLFLSVSAVDSHHPSPARQDVSSRSSGVRRNDFTGMPRSRRNAAARRRPILGLRALACRDGELIEQPGPQAGLTVVDAAPPHRERLTRRGKRGADRHPRLSILVARLGERKAEPQIPFSLVTRERRRASGFHPLETFKQGQ
jgi:hypothetical protein